MMWCGCPWSVAAIIRTVACVALAASIIVALCFLPFGQILEDFIFFIKDDVGPWGPLIMILAYIPATVLALPGLFLSFGGGYLFGLGVGFITDSVGATTGAVAAFIVGRTVGRSYVEKLLKDYPRFTAITNAIEKSSFKIVLLLRLVPLVPFNLLNYALALTPIRLTTYVAASLIGVMPMTLAFVYIGTTLKDISDIQKGHAKAPNAVRWAIFAFGFVATVVATVVITKIARDALQQAIEQEESAMADEENVPPPGDATAAVNGTRSPVARQLNPDMQQPLLDKVDKNAVSSDDIKKWIEKDANSINRLAPDNVVSPTRVPSDVLYVNSKLSTTRGVAKYGEQSWGFASKIIGNNRGEGCADVESCSTASGGRGRFKEKKG